METIKQYFPGISDQQLQQLEQLGALYKEWNQKINVISRKDIDNVYKHHILHAMAIAKLIRFVPTANVLDLGTGGGLPGIPLAILFPETHFHCVDGTGKKIKVVEEISGSLGLKNVQPQHIRAEQLRKKSYDFVVCRAVASLDKLVHWSMPLIHFQQKHAMPNGLLTLKGGTQIRQEMDDLPRGTYIEIYPLSKFYADPYFEEKVIVYVQA